MSDTLGDHGYERPVTTGGVDAGVLPGQVDLLDLLDPTTDETTLDHDLTHDLQEQS